MQYGLSIFPIVLVGMMGSGKTTVLVNRVAYLVRFGNAYHSSFMPQDITEEDIKAKLEHGVLSLQIPKKEAKPQLPEKKYIAIEG